MSVNVWANGPGTPGFICEDARLTDRDVHPWFWQDRGISRTDREYGQAGWDIGVNYSGLGDLVEKLSDLARPKWVEGMGVIRQGEIRCLAIHAHGNAGQVHVNGRDGPSLTAESVPSMRIELYRIGLMLPDDAHNPAMILLVGCVAAQGKEGTALLTRLSKFWPNRKVVGFVTLGYVAGGEMYRSGASCTEPGMRDTNALYPGQADDTAGKYWGNLLEWPWASETSPHSKIALNGVITKGANW
jgi:hypothetical protein